MASLAIVDWLLRIPRRRKRDALLAEAAAWPMTSAKLLTGKVVSRDPLAEGGTSFQDSQIESPYFFTVDGSYYGGHLRGVPMSDSEAHRALRLVPEDTEVTVRYNPVNPGQTATLAADNPSFPDHHLAQLDRRVFTTSNHRSGRNGVLPKPNQRSFAVAASSRLYSKTARSLG